ncbi:aminotransferase class I/II-fold pyridoxal phosphate-dependent enzyme [bacterium]|nr:aminotransferase class I/II-fold pyridoxal phosphate-dependent enzyme [bacterium]
MAAVLTTLLASATAGQTILAQESLYSATYGFMTEIARRYQIQTVLVPDIDPQTWEDAFAAHPDAVLAYAETPANPTMQLSDLAAIAQIARRCGAKLAVDNTFASPYCQRPLSLGADIVIHSTTKYLNGHGTTIGGAVVARDAAWVRGGLLQMQEMLGGSASPFDSWLTNLGLRTFELRMQRHCANAAQIAAFLENHPAVARVNYPGLESFAQHELARRQMLHYGGMLSFELKGGLEAGARMMDRMQVCTLAVSLGNVDTLIEHPASMTHNSVPAEARQKIGITDGLVRLSVGIENVEDLLVDLDQAMGG